MVRATVARVLLGSLALVCGLLLLVNITAGPTTGTPDLATRAGTTSFGDPGGVAVDRRNVTVVTGQTFGDRPGDALLPIETGGDPATVVPERGELLYYDNSHDEYHDVDPVLGTRVTVMYVASTHLAAAECGATRPCTLNVVERGSVSTGEWTRFYSSVQPREEGNDVHDVDRISGTELLVADTVNDRVFVLNTTTELVTWERQATSAFPVSGGGPYPDDWTHLNDVEYLPGRGANGWVMVSLRNQDQVMFVDREHGLVENWTLGAESRYAILYGQHNPDYIPRENGGPAVLVADSQNDRIIEHQRDGDDWRRTWRFGNLDWPPDADRLPNGDTMIVDSNGGRPLKMSPAGEVVRWTRIPFDRDAMYEAETVGTGNESSGGPSAASMAERSPGRASERATAGAARSPTGDGNGDGLTDRVPATVDSLARTVLPPKVRNAALFVVPLRIGPGELLLGAVLLGTLLAWGALELRWRSTVRVELRSPIRLRRR